MIPGRFPLVKKIKYFELAIGSLVSVMLPTDLIIIEDH